MHNFFNHFFRLPLQIFFSLFQRTPQDEYEAKIALLHQEIAECKNALTAAREENNKLRERPASFAVLAAPIRAEQAETVEKQLVGAAAKFGLEGARMMVFHSSSV